MVCSFCAFVALLCAVSAQSIDDWYDDFEYNSFIDGEEMFQVFWTPNEAACTVEFGLAVQTDSYAALGISESGGMGGSDIVMGWITDDGEYILQNRYATGRSFPPMMSSQSGIRKIEGWKEEVNGTVMTYIRFEKDTFPETEFGVNIKLGTTRVIYAWGSDPMQSNSEPIRHCNECRGPQSMNLLQGDSKEVPLPDDALFTDVLVPEHLVPADETTYHCSLHELPRYDDKQHVVRFDPLIYPEENEGIVHHILLYHCPEDQMNASWVGQSWECDSMLDNMAPRQCRGGTVFAGWAIGGGNFYFPENVGLEMSGTDYDAIQYVLIEMHYDNPQLRDDIVDNSGLRLHYTPTLREHSASVLNIGAAVSPFSQLIPPGLEELTNLGYCHGECTDSAFPEEGVLAFANMLHMHLLGRSMVLRHIRDGVELRPLDLNEAYDFDYQQYVPFTEQIRILPGDDFIVECGMDSSGRSEMTYGGEATSEEMCMTFLMVYPKVSLARCMSQFTYTDMLFFLYQASELGYYSGFSWDPENITNGFYDVSVPGAADFYHQFQIGNITGNFDGFPDTELSDPQERLQYCRGLGGQPIDGDSREDPIPIPGRDYVEYDMDDYYVCEGEAASSNSFEWEWDAWYVYVGAAVLALVLLVVAGCAIVKCRKGGAQDGYQRQENTYGTQDKISMH